tara:strand:- start:3155 stop:4441 length:1287 start_codon:yes stop_codon:yes gene_type:complete
MLLKLIPNKLKVWLIKHLYADIAAMGDGGDTTLAHVNLTEVAILKAHGGAGTINPRTGLVEFKGGKGGGGGGAQTSTSYSTNLPEYAKPFYEELMKQTGKQTYQTDASGNVTGVKEYTPYTGERVAGFTPGQLAVQGEVAGMETPGGFGTAASQLGTVGTIAGGATIGGLGKAFGYDPESFAPGAVTTGSFTDAGVADKYMDPYTQGVVDVQKREAQRMADMQSNQAAMASIGRGTFGGGREALMTGERDRNTQDLLNKIQMEGGTNAYNQALKAFEAEQGRGLQAQTTNVQSALEAAKLGQQGQQFAAGVGKDIGLAGLQAGLEGAKATGALSATEQMSNLERLKAQAASAGEQQAYQQEIDNIQYQQYMEAQDYQRKLLEYQSNILRGTAGALGSTQTQYAPAPSLASQIGGVGLAGLGLYNVLGG